MNTELVICSYAPDIPWLRYCLKSVKKFASGFSGVTLIVPWSDLNKFIEFEGPATKDGKCLYVKCYHPYPGRGHLSHQVQKLYADVYCRNADFIAHIDSDSIFCKDVNPSDLIKDGKSTIYYHPYSSYAPGAAELWWKPQVERALKIDPQAECMQHMPLVYKRNLYRSVRDRIEETNFIPVNEFCISQKPDPLWGLTEFNTLGAWAMYAHKDEYNFIDLSNKENKADKIVHQSWSQTLHQPGLQDKHREQIEQINIILGETD